MALPPNRGMARGDAHQDVASSFLQQQPCAEKLRLDACRVRAGHVALGEREDDRAARLLRMLQRLFRLHTRSLEVSKFLRQGTQLPLQSLV